VMASMIHLHREQKLPTKILTFCSHNYYLTVITVHYSLTLLLVLLCYKLSAA
jgi:hypothetical protein